MGLFSKREKRKPQIVDVDNEIHRISKYMYEFEGRIESIIVEKILITEKDYHSISTGLTKIIAETIEEQSIHLNKTQSFTAISKGQNLVSRIIDKLYDIDWVY